MNSKHTVLKTFCVLTLNSHDQYNYHPHFANGETATEMLSNLVKVTQLNWEVGESRNWDLNQSQLSPKPSSSLNCYAKLHEQTKAQENISSNINNMVKWYM